VKIKVVIFWSVTPCKVVEQQCSGYTFLTMHLNPEDGGSTTSETLISNHYITWHQQPGKPQNTTLLLPHFMNCFEVYRNASELKISQHI